MQCLRPAIWVIGAPVGFAGFLRRLVALRQVLAGVDVQAETVQGDGLDQAALDRRVDVERVRVGDGRFRWSITGSCIVRIWPNAVTVQNTIAVPSGERQVRRTVAVAVLPRCRGIGAAAVVHGPRPATDTRGPSSFRHAR